MLKKVRRRRLVSGCHGASISACSQAVCARCSMSRAGKCLGRQSGPHRWEGEPAHWRTTRPSATTFRPACSRSARRLLPLSPRPRQLQGFQAQQACRKPRHPSPTCPQKCRPGSYPCGTAPASRQSASCPAWCGTPRGTPCGPGETQSPSYRRPRPLGRSQSAKGLGAL